MLHAMCRGEVCRGRKAGPAFCKNILPLTRPLGDYIAAEPDCFLRGVPRMIMITLKRSTAIAIALYASSALCGCATTSLERKDFKSYAVGQTLSAPVGGTFLMAQAGSVERVKTWVGIMNAPGGWRIENRYSEDWVRRELIYSGVAGNTVEISYREFRGGYAAPAFYQSVKYDLAESHTVKFQNFQIEILSATNQGISCRLLRD
jgi:hypothetical protein